MHDLVDVLQGMVQDIPTAKAQPPIHFIPLPTVPISTKPPVVMTTALESSQSETAGTILISSSPTPKEEEAGTSGTEITPASPTPVLEIQHGTTKHIDLHTVVLDDKSTPTSPEPVLEIHHDPSEPVDLHTVVSADKSTPTNPGPVLEIHHGTDESVNLHTIVSADKSSPASHTPVLEIHHGTSEPVVLHIDQTTTEKPMVSVSLLIEKATTKKSAKSLDQLTNGALSNLEQSLENVKKLNGILDTFTKKEGDQESKGGKGHKKKPTAEDILGLVKKLIQTLKSTPSFVKEDRKLNKYIQTAENYIKEALDLTEKAEKKLQVENPSTALPAREHEIPLVPTPEPLPEPTVIVHEISPPPAPLAKKAEDAQVEMGKLKAFINLLYGFSPHLTTYTKNTARKKVAEDIVDRALAVLHAIKSVFCGSEEAQSKQALKELLKEDMALMSQAMKDKRAS